jgi:hypothetical protein
MSLADYNTDGGRVAVVKKQPPNMYTGMLLVAVVALAVGCLFSFLELQSYSGMNMSTGVSSDAKVSSVPPPNLAPTADPAMPDGATPMG